MNIDKAIKLIQLDIDDEDVDWDTLLGEAYKLSFEALKRYGNLRWRNRIPDWELLLGETEE